MKRKWINRILGRLYDLALWPHPRPWPWSFKVRVWNSLISGMVLLIDMEWKGWESSVHDHDSVTMVGWADVPDSDRIVTGVTYAVCLLSTYVVYDKSEQSGELPDSVNIPSFLCYGIYGIANISSGVSIEIWHCVMSKCNVWNVQAKTDPIIFLLNTKVVCLWLRHVVLNRHLAAVITKIFFGGGGGALFFFPLRWWLWLQSSAAITRATITQMPV